MYKFVAALMCIITGVYLIAVSVRPRRKYITLSGHYQGRTWVKRI